MIAAAPPLDHGGEEGVGQGDDGLAVDPHLLGVAPADRAPGSGPEVPKPALLTSRSTSTPSSATRSGSAAASRGEVAGDDVRVGRKLGGEALQAVGAAGDQDQVVAAGGELAGELFADSRRGARDEGRFGASA